MKKILFILIVLSVLAGNVSAYAGCNGNYSENHGCPNGDRCSTQLNLCVSNSVGTTAAAPPIFPKMFYIPATSKAVGFNIEKVPSYILDDAPLVTFLEEISLALISFGFVYNIYLNLYRLATGQEAQNKSYYQLLMQLVWALALVGAWEYGLFFNQYLSVVDSLQVYITNNLILGSMSNGILTTIKGMISQFNYKGGGFEWYNPFTWHKLGQLAVTAIEEFFLSGLLFIIYLLYVLIYFIIYLFQLLILGLLYGVFPIFVGINLGEYSAKLSPLFNWFKWFFEVSTWGVVLLLENVFFNLTVSNYFASAGYIKTATGLSLVVAIGLLVVMIVMLIIGPFLIHKIFALTAGHEHRNKGIPSSDTRQQMAKVAKAFLTGGASIPADAAAEAGKKAAASTAQKAQNPGGDAAVKPQERAGGAVAPGVFQQPNNSKNSQTRQGKNG